MKRTNFLLLIFHVLFIGVFNTIFFLLKGTDNHASVWISYGAIHLAYVLVWLLPLSGFRTINVFNISAKIIGYIFFVIEFLVGIIFIAVEPEGWKFVFIVQLLIFFLYAVPLVFSMIGGQYAHEGTGMLDNITKNAMQTDYIKMAGTKINVLMRGTMDMDMKMQVSDVAELFKNNIGQDKNTQKLLDYTTKFVSAVGSKNVGTVQGAKAELVGYIQN